MSDEWEFFIEVILCENKKFISLWALMLMKTYLDLTTIMTMKPVWICSVCAWNYATDNNKFDWEMKIFWVEYDYFNWVF